jgi:hypothetical protein
MCGYRLKIVSLMGKIFWYTRMFIRAAMNVEYILDPEYISGIVCGS